MQIRLTGARMAVAAGLVLSGFVLAAGVTTTTALGRDSAASSLALNATFGAGYEFGLRFCPPRHACHDRGVHRLPR